MREWGTGLCSTNAELTRGWVTPTAGDRSTLRSRRAGLRALKKVGLAEQVLADAVPMRGRMIHPATGALAYQPYGRRGVQAINSVSRGGLNLALIEAADAEANVTIHFERRCDGVDLETGRATLTDAANKVVGEVETDVVIGADGAFSAVRGSLAHTNRFDYSQTYLAHGYKELTIPPGEGEGDGRFRIEKNALHIWPRGGHMMIALPNADGSFTCTLFWPFEGKNSFAALQTEADIRAHFEWVLPDAVALIPDLVHDFQQNPTGSLVTVRCRPWRLDDRVVLIGDACHAVVPFYGQGMNAAFEDCCVLSECIEKHGVNLGAAFGDYESIRKDDCDTLQNLALKQFIEMRDKTASPAFRRKKWLERTLARWLPRWYTPLYEMVTFSTESYAESVERAGRQDRVLQYAARGLVALVVLSVWLWWVFA